MEEAHNNANKKEAIELTIKVPRYFLEKITKNILVKYNRNKEPIIDPNAIRSVS